MSSLQRDLDRTGYLSLSKFVEYLREEHPYAYISYPTARMLVVEGRLRAVKIGKQYRIMRAEAERWIEEGNSEGGNLSPYSDPFGVKKRHKPDKLEDF
jgi:excisionase family DNA binding protein